MISLSSPSLASKIEPLSGLTVHPAAASDATASFHEMFARTGSEKRAS